MSYIRDAMLYILPNFIAVLIADTCMIVDASHSVHEVRGT